jgi:hypothetical protein
MKPDIERVVDANCPAAGIADGAPQQSSQGPPPASQPIVESDTVKWDSPGVLGFSYDCTLSSKGKITECKVISLVRGFPAHKDGRIRPGDRLLKVNGKQVAGLTSKEIKELLGGEVGSRKELLLLTDGREISVKLTSISAKKDAI